MNPEGCPESALGAHLNGTVWGALGGGLTMIPLFAVSLIIPGDVPPLRELPWALENLLLFSGFAFFVAYTLYFLGSLCSAIPSAGPSNARAMRARARPRWLVAPSADWWPG